MGITTHRGSRDLLFRDGETLRLLVRANHPVYYYVMGNGVLPDKRFSYLLPLYGSPLDDPAPEQWANSTERFVKYLPPRQVNHEVEVGEFQITAPHGIEHVQVFASTKPFGPGQLPGVRYERRTATLVGQQREQHHPGGDSHPRAHPKQADGSAAEVSESVLTFTTRP